MVYSNKMMKRKNFQELYCVKTRYARTRPSEVEVWSVERLPFEQKPESEWLRQLRRDVGAAVVQLGCCGGGPVLYGRYESSNPDLCDTENILFYNVGMRCFAELSRWGIRFERTFHEPPMPPRILARPPAHYHLYSLGSRTTSFKYWETEPPSLVEFNRISCGRSLESIWYGLKTHIDKVGPRAIKWVKPSEEPTRFGLNVKIRAPRSSVPSLAGVLKTVFDGVVSAFHQHDGTDLEEVSKRLAVRLERDWREISDCLKGPGMAVLGPRKLLWRRGKGLQWNPADDRCVAGQLLFEEGSTEGFWELSGELFRVREALMLYDGEDLDPDWLPQLRKMKSVDELFRKGAITSEEREHRIRQIRSENKCCFPKH